MSPSPISPTTPILSRDSRVPLRSRNLGAARPRGLFASEFSVKSASEGTATSPSGLMKVETSDCLGLNESSPTPAPVQMGPRKRVLSPCSSPDGSPFKLPPISAVSEDFTSPRISKKRLSFGASPSTDVQSAPWSPTSSPGPTKSSAKKVFSETTGHFLEVREIKVLEEWTEQKYEENEVAPVEHVRTPLSTKKEMKKKSPQSLPAPPKMEKKTNRRFSQLPRDLSANMINMDGTKSPATCSGYDKTSGISFLNQMFHILALVGKGCFGEVIAVRDRKDQNESAVKVLTRKVVQSSEVKYREVITLMSVPAHPNILHFEKAWEENDRLFIQTELCQWTLLEYATHRVNIPEPQLWKFLGQLASALAHLHTANFVHADIKPDNIFLTEDFVCKLGDFGLAFNANDSNGVRDAEEGDSRYLAAEVLLSGQPTKEADVFSLGVTMLEVATNMHIPSNGDGWNAIRDGQVEDRFFAGISRKLKTLIEEMLAKDPATRPSAKDLLNRVEV